MTAPYFFVSGKQFVRTRDWITLGVAAPDGQEWYRLYCQADHGWLWHPLKSHSGEVEGGLSFVSHSAIHCIIFWPIFFIPRPSKSVNMIGINNNEIFLDVI
jgi:hypothetical protein